MATYYVSLSLSNSARLDDSTMIRLLREAAERAGCAHIEVSARGLIVEAEAVSVQTLEEELRFVLTVHGAEVDRVTATRI